MVFEKVVAIDGPSGSGKSTLAKALSQRLDFLYVDTGAMFRALAVKASDQLDSHQQQDPSSVASWLPTLSLDYRGKDGELIFINQENLTTRIRDHHISNLASQLSKMPCVRTYLQEAQRDLVKDRYCIMEGRDIGTVIFPHSFCKIFLTASLDVRAKRRFAELTLKNPQLTLEQVQKDMLDRDERDSQREMAPLKKASDAIEVDSGNQFFHQSFEDELQHVIGLIHQAAKNKNMILPSLPLVL
jgi:cytidylate kinase